MKKADSAVAAILVVFGLLSLFVIIPGQISRDDAVFVQPALFPTILMLVVTLLSLGQLVISLIPKKTGKPEYSVPLSARQILYAVALCGLLMGFLAIVNYIGFIPAGIFLITSMMIYLGSRNPVKIALNAILGPSIIYFAFKYLFGVILP